MFCNHRSKQSECRGQGSTQDILSVRNSSTNPANPQSCLCVCLEASRIGWQRAPSSWGTISQHNKSASVARRRRRKESQGHKAPRITSRNAAMSPKLSPPGSAKFLEWRPRCDMIETFNMSASQAMTKARPTYCINLKAPRYFAHRLFSIAEAKLLSPPDRPSQP